MPRVGVKRVGPLAIGLVLLAPVLARAQATQPEPAALPTSGPLVLDRVTVVDVEHGALLSDQRVVITGNHIQAAGKAKMVSVPKSARVVDARGKYLIPGLWDMHVHTKSDLSFPLLIANGVTGIRDAWTDIPLDTMVQWRQEILAGRRVGPPRQLLAGKSFGQHYTSMDSMDIQRTVDSLKAHGATFLKVYPFMPVFATAIRRSGLPFGGHVHSYDAAEASDSGIRIIDHLNTSGGLDSLCVDSSRRSVARCQPLAEQFRRNGTWFVPTVAALAPRVGEYDADGHVFTHVFLAPRAQRLAAALAARIPTFWDSTPPGGHWLREPPRPAKLESAGSASDSLDDLRLLQDLDLPLLAGSDLPIGPLDLQTLPTQAPGFSLQLELASLVADGLTPLNALRAATLNPAKLLHGTDSLGTVAAGRLADLVLLDGNPLADITNTTQIRAVVANGRYFDRAALDRLITEARARHQDRSQGTP